ncbi:hypothetical protein HYH03_005194 [Edaphochlamys debaryana]|uniref:MYND-type domain-containing protein n=1 Tax=Edaphochlamys debaryana TaxID=47281 RepID=A0A835Y6A2_9CHLO|nr:hypothetical protein HYH03_005194 [Edaphochlamys debaryana]|eukprot:KAG2496786.1 hypothetical protein HYH03_005194 [Edaphochlamys debaryana]
MLCAQRLTSGFGPNDKDLPFRAAQASPFVERFLGARLYYVDSATGKELTLAEAQTRLAQAAMAGQAAGLGLGQAELELGPMRSGWGVDPRAYGTITADELVAALVVIQCIQIMGDWVPGFKLALGLMGEGSTRQRVTQVLLPALAAMDEGEPHHMTRDQWETVWPEAAARDLRMVVRTQAPTEPAYATAQQLLLEIADRLPRVEPQRPMTYYWPHAIADKFLITDKMLSHITTMARLGEEQGHDYASAFGHWLTAALALKGLPRRPALPVGELRALAAKAEAAGRRLRRCHMEAVLKAAARLHIGFVRAALADTAGQPDDEAIPLPYCSPEELRAAASGRSAEFAARPVTAPDERGCDGCGVVFVKYLRCGGCRQRRYCGRSCQAADWKAGHKQQCKQLAAAAAAEKAGAGAEEDADD